jgi:tol-pal system protein YbgF
MTSKISTLCAAVLMVACSALPLQAHAFEDADARREILKLREQLRDLNNRINNEIEQLARRIDTKADDKKVNALFTDLEKLRSQLRGEVAELRGQVEIFSNDLNKAQQKVDKLGNDLANAQQREKDLYADIEKRLSKLEPRRQTIDGVDHEVTQGEQKLFDEATASLKKKDFAAATQGFLSFLQRFPGSGYTAQAYYFLGSSYFAEGDCKNAMPALQTVINRFPLSQRAPDAMLNLAICQDDLNDKSAARDTLEALIKKYPASSAATNAKSRLGTLK